MFAALQCLVHLQWQQYARLGSRLLEGRLCTGQDISIALSRHGQIRRISATHTQTARRKHDAYRTPPKNYVQLLQHITRARKVDTLKKLVVHYGHKFDAVHVAAAMSVLPKVYQPVAVKTSTSTKKIKQQRQVPSQLLEQLQVLAGAQVPRMFAREVASITWSLGRLRALLPSRGRDTGTRQLLSSLVQRLSQNSGRLLYQGATGAEVAKLLHGMAKLGYGDMRAVKQLCRFIHHQPDRLHAKELAAAAWALARLGPQGDDVAAAMDAISSKAVELKLFMRPATICSLLTAAAHLGRRDQQLLAALTEEAHEQLTDFKAPQLAVLVWALGRLQYSQPQLVAAVTSVSRQQLKHFGSTELALLLKGLRQLQGLDKQLLAEVAAGICQEHKVSLTPRDAVQILAAYITVPDAGSRSDVEGMAVRIAAAIRSKLFHAKPHVVTNLLVCYSKLQCLNPVVLTMLQQAVEQPDSFTLPNWVRLLQSCKRLGLGVAAVTDKEVVDFYRAADQRLQQHLLGAAAPSTAAAVEAAAQAAATGSKEEQQVEKQQGLWQRLTGKGKQTKKEEQPDEQQQQQRHDLQFGPATNMALLLSERGMLGPRRPALSETSVVYLADVGAKVLPQMTLRRLIDLLTAVLSADQNAALDDVRRLLVASGNKLQATDFSQVPLPLLVGLTKPLGRAVSKNMLVKQGEGLLLDVYEQLMKEVDQCTEQQLITVCDSMFRSGVVHKGLLARAEAVAQERGCKLPKHQEWQAFM